MSENNKFKTADEVLQGFQDQSSTAKFQVKSILIHFAVLVFVLYTYIAIEFELPHFIDLNEAKEHSILFACLLLIPFNIASSVMGIKKDKEMAKWLEAEYPDYIEVLKGNEGSKGARQSIAGFYIASRAAWAKRTFRTKQIMWAVAGPLSTLMVSCYFKLSFSGAEVFYDVGLTLLLILFLILVAAYVILLVSCGRISKMMYGKCMDMIRADEEDMSEADAEFHYIKGE